MLFKHLELLTFSFSNYKRFNPEMYSNKKKICQMKSTALLNSNN